MHQENTFNMVRHPTNGGWAAYRRDGNVIRLADGQDGTDRHLLFSPGRRRSLAKLNKLPEALVC